ncbi:hypothetical protein [Paracoccus marinaquae]|uniref:Uncharacterized protein n=1 Tax=Paracoccus marinaquae TaxID=2841926 RepID=A0ABS6AQB9_9RHOB|nr:hypothetical protein [Paracoccus marinaquae]MBU3031839.1 hypothetical protein [Paracoccus marinaquae]
MIELIFTACLAAMPEHCRERTLLYTDITVNICMAQSQPVLAGWASDHPNWRIRTWTCRVQDPTQARI